MSKYGILIQSTFVLKMKCVRSNKNAYSEFKFTDATYFLNENVHI